MLASMVRIESNYATTNPVAAMVFRIDLPDIRPLVP